MKMTQISRFFGFKCLITAALFCLSGNVIGEALGRHPLNDSAPIQTSVLKSEIKDFLATEIAAHFGDIKSLNPPPDRVFGALTTGEFSWGSYMRALAAQAELSGNRTI